MTQEEVFKGLVEVMENYMTSLPEPETEEEADDLNFGMLGALMSCLVTLSMHLDISRGDILDGIVDVFQEINPNYGQEENDEDLVMSEDEEGLGNDDHSEDDEKIYH